MFGGVFGAAIFGDVVFADLDELSGVVPGGRGLIGGSGFPADWAARVNVVLPGADLDEREIEELIAVGLLG